MSRLQEYKEKLKKLFALGSYDMYQWIAFGIFVVLFGIAIYFVSYSYRQTVMPPNKVDAIYTLFNTIGFAIPVILYFVADKVNYQNLEEVNRGLQKQKFTRMITNMIKLFTFMLLAIRLWFFYKPKPVEKTIKHILDSLNRYDKNILEPVYHEIRKFKPENI